MLGLIMSLSRLFNNEVKPLSMHVENHLLLLLHGLQSTMQLIGSVQRLQVNGYPWPSQVTEVMAYQKD